MQEQLGAAYPETWRLLDLSDPDAYMNMAIEEAVMRAVGAGQSLPTLRLWQNHNAVIIGNFQDASEEANLEVCRQLGTAVVRRISGGGAVYHDRGNLNYALSVPLAHRLVPSDVLASYRFFCQGLIDALVGMGLRAEYVPINDIVVQGRKVSGTAQARRWDAVLHHGTLLLTLDVETMARVLRVKREYLEAKGVADVRQRVATLAQLGVQCSVEEAKKAVIAGYACALGVTFVPGTLSGFERSLAEQLYQDKYTTPEWNLAAPRDQRDDKGHAG